VLDRRLEVAKQRKAEVGFVNEVLASAHCELIVFVLGSPLRRIPCVLCGIHLQVYSSTTVCRPSCRGFCKDGANGDDLVSPLDKSAQQISSTLQSLQTSIQPLYDSSPNPMFHPQISGVGTKAWELGRQAYLNWAVGKMVNKDGGDSMVIDGVEQEMQDMGGQEGLGRAMANV
jgi:hypothetical protein